MSQTSLDTSPDKVLGESVTRLLCDKLYEKRKCGANEVQQMVQKASQRNESAPVQRIIAYLKTHYIESEEAALRKGGLIGLSGVAIGLGTRKLADELPQLVKLVASLFSDRDARVRYYACESLFKISQVANVMMVQYFNVIFEGLGDLYADNDQDVAKGVGAVDELIREYVKMSPETFDTAGFVPLIEKKVRHKNHHIRQNVLQWVQWLLKLDPLRLQLVQRLPAYLEGILDMLEEKLPRDIRHYADSCLVALLKGVKSSPESDMLNIMSSTVDILVQCCEVKDRRDTWAACRRLIAVQWLNDYVEMKFTRTQDPEDNKKWLDMIPQLLVGSLHCLSAKEAEIVPIAVKLNNGLLKLVGELPGEIPVAQLLEGLLKPMESRKDDALVVRTVCLQWLVMLLDRNREQVLGSETLDRLLVPVFDTLLSERDSVVAAALAVLGRIMDGTRDEEEFARVTRELLQLFRKQPEMLELKGGTIIRHLCGNLNGRHLYVTVARFIQFNSDDIEFAQRLVQTFSWVLLTAAETKALRDELLKTKPLQEFPGGADRSLFLDLLEPWFFNPASALALCLWAQQYEFAVEIINRLAVCDSSVDMLRQLDQLVHLLESPVFSGLRLRLLEPRRHPALFKCLLGLAMLLPQAGAFKALSERIRVVQSGLLLEFQQMEQQLLDQSRTGGAGPPALGASTAVGVREPTAGLRPAASPRGAGAGNAGAPAPARDEDPFGSLLERFDEIAAASNALA